MSDATCENFAEASKAQAAGLAVAATVCPSCTFRNLCEYQRSKKAAERAPHKVACHARGELRLVELARGATFVSVHEDCRELLKPTSTCTLVELQAVENLARHAKHERNNNPDAAEWRFFDALELVASWLAEFLNEVNETNTLDFASWRNDELTKDWQRTAWKAIETNFLDAKRLGNALPLCAAILSGELHELSVVVHTSYQNGHGQQKQIVKWVQGSWLTALPAKATILVGDATADAKAIGRLTSREPIDITPDGRLSNEHELTQYVAHDVTKGMSERTAAVELRSILVRYPNAERVGVIGHREHVEAWLDDERPTLDAATRSRIVEWAYFGEGPDRGSNTWHAECDLLVVVGTPRVGGDAVRSELVRQGQLEAAKLLEPIWEKHFYEARNAAGELVVVESKRYANVAWREAYQLLTVASLKQAIGRSRTICEEGRPCAVLSDERLEGVTVETAAMPRVTEQLVAVVEIVKRLEIASTHQVAESAELSERHVRRLLDAAAEVGLVAKSGLCWFVLEDASSDKAPNTSTLGAVSVSVTPPPGVDEERLAIIAEGNRLDPQATVAELAALGLLSWGTSAVTLDDLPQLSVSDGPPPLMIVGTACEPAETATNYAVFSPFLNEPPRATYRPARASAGEPCQTSWRGVAWPGNASREAVFG